MQSPLGVLSAILSFCRTDEEASIFLLGIALMGSPIMSDCVVWLDNGFLIECCFTAPIKMKTHAADQQQNNFIITTATLAS